MVNQMEYNNNVLVNRPDVVVLHNYEYADPYRLFVTDRYDGSIRVVPVDKEFNTMYSLYTDAGDQCILVFFNMQRLAQTDIAGAIAEAKEVLAKYYVSELEYDESTDGLELGDVD